MTISACILAKEADGDLRRCLRSLHNKVDETVIVCEMDRVSAMRQLLRSRDRVVPFAWTDDFSAARNAAFEVATGDWLLVIDADEALDGDLRELVRQIPAHIDCSYITHMNVADGLGNIGSKASQFRLFRNGIGWRYEGRIHEQPVLAVRVGPPTFATQDGVTIFHWGYLPERMAVKHVRNLALLQRAAEDEPESIFARFNLGGQHLSREDFHQALGPFREAIALWEAAEHPALAFVPALFMYAIYAAVKARQLEDAIKIAAQAPKEAFTPDYFYYTAMASWDSGFKDDAVGLLQRGLDAPIDSHFHEPSIPGRIREALEALAE